MSLTPLSFWQFLCHWRDPGSSESWLCRILLLCCHGVFLSVQLQVMCSPLQMCLLSLRIVFPYLFPNNSGAGVTSSRLSICNEYDPRFQLGRRIRTHLLKLTPVPVPQLAQDRVIFLNSCSTSSHNHCLYPSFSAFCSVWVHRGKFPWKMAKEPQKIPSLLTLPPLRRCSLASHQGVTLWIIKVQNFHRCQKIPYLSWQKHASLLFVLNKASVNHCSA